MLYASETWALKKTDVSKLLAFEMKCYRRILRIGWKQKVKNEDIRERLGITRNNISIIKERKLKLFGHMCRLKDDRLVKHVLFGDLRGKKKRGRPCREWMDDIRDWSEKTSHKLVDIARDRNEWKSFVREVCGPYG